MHKKKFWEEFSWIVFFVLFIIFLKVCVVGFYLVPSPSMQPALQPGDRIITNKLSYGFSLPFIQTLIWQWSVPQRGDIILFSFSNKNEIYIKRVIGLPGDLISFQEGHVLINGEALQLKKLPVEKNINNGDHYLYQEKNARYFKKLYEIYLSIEPGQTFFEERRFLVPPGKLFVLGDNRDNSADSRVYGYVDTKRVYGNARFILFSSKGDSLLPKFLFNRFFKAIDVGN